MDLNSPVTKTVWAFVLFCLSAQSGNIVSTLIQTGWGVPQTPSVPTGIRSLAMRDSANLIPSPPFWEGNGQWNEQRPHHGREYTTDVKNRGFRVTQTCEQIPVLPELTWKNNSNLNLNPMNFYFRIWMIEIYYPYKTYLTGYSGQLHGNSSMCILG